MTDIIWPNPPLAAGDTTTAPDGQPYTGIVLNTVLMWEPDLLRPKDIRQVIASLDFTTAEPNVVASAGQNYINTTSGNGSISTTRTFAANYVYHSNGTGWVEVPFDSSIPGIEVFDLQLSRQARWDGVSWDYSNTNKSPSILESLAR